MATVRQIRRAESLISSQHPDAQGVEFDSLVQELLDKWAAEAAAEREFFGEPEDTYCIESGRDNCDDWGTGEGEYHGRF